MRNGDEDQDDGGALPGLLFLMGTVTEAPTQDPGTGLVQLGREASLGSGIGRAKSR
jgi:hypothetical protein